jgi:primosomal protein N'
MNITCTHLEELEDGGAIVSLEMDDESKVELINMGFIAMLQNYIAQQHAVEEEEEEEEEEAEWSWDLEEEEEEEVEEDPYAAIIAELKTCYEYYALEVDDEEGKTAELAHAASQLLTLYMGEEAASDYFWNLTANVWNEWAE